jgi:hypothetical protein
MAFSALAHMTPLEAVLQWIFRVKGKQQPESAKL